MDKEFSAPLQPSFTQAVQNADARGGPVDFSEVIDELDGVHCWLSTTRTATTVAEKAHRRHQDIGRSCRRSKPRDAGGATAASHVSNLLRIWVGAGFSIKNPVVEPCVASLIEEGKKV